MLKLDETFVPLPTAEVCSMTPSLGQMLTDVRQPTGKESIAERWILSKLNEAAQEVNRQLADRNFMMATQAIYTFWLYELCDVYIVRPTRPCLPTISDRRRNL